MFKTHVLLSMALFILACILAIFILSGCSTQKIDADEEWVDAKTGLEIPPTVMFTVPFPIPVEAWPLPNESW